MVFNDEEFLPHESLDHQIDYKLKYKALKRKLKFLVYEQESFLEELRKSQRKLLKLSRDRSFLLDRLLQYEKTEDTSGDSDMTASSDSDDGHKDTSHSKKRRSGTSPVAGGGGGGGAGGGSQSSEPAGGVIKSEPLSHARASSPDMINKKRPKAVARKGGKTSRPKSHPGKLTSAGATIQMTREELERHLESPKLHLGKLTSGGTTIQMTREELERHLESPKSHLGKLTSGGTTIQMTREELERHLDSRQPFLGFDKAPALLPSEIFNNDNSNQWSGSGAGGDEEDTDLIIDMVQ